MGQSKVQHEVVTDRYLELWLQEITAMDWISRTVGARWEGSIKQGRWSHELRDVREQTQGYILCCGCCTGLMLEKREQAGTAAHHPLQRNLLPASKCVLFINQPTAPQCATSPSTPQHGERCIQSGMALGCYASRSSWVNYNTLLRIITEKEQLETRSWNVNGSKRNPDNKAQLMCVELWCLIT